ncbi:PREDICTED: leukocyte-associated immunoglobulin-like receptor 1 [Miniopterus natalensis]|uniref:leukocyte-associated immunoglobulin-like receptor 1 n=1 Tax=Miniopterus natalensis TaxID=291302 RepID=UPI0007A6E83E|nr:PREDICTED: leukocyte-associated immunoglobulin-like receptor 1 [Miniopterus natalensis]
MSPRPTALLGLVFCLGQMIHRHEGALPKPSISAEPGPVVPRGQPVSIVCRGPDRVDIFRLENGRYNVSDQQAVSQPGSLGTEATFHFPAASKDTARSYHCLYRKGGTWSERSEPLELKVTEDVPSSPSGLMTKYVYVLVGTSVVFLLCLLLLVLLLLHRGRQKKHGSPHGKGKEQRPQERLSPAADITESTPDVATVCKLPEKKREMHSPSPAAEDTQEVTYAQLDQQALTLRAAQAVSPQPTEPTADSSVYAALSRR